MESNVVITGIGLILPQLHTTDELWNFQRDGKNRIIELSDKISGSLIHSDEMDSLIPQRQAQKLDVFTKYALIATEGAISDSGLNLDKTDKERCGVFVGNGFGGWRFTERELRNLYRHGPRLVSPFQATSWFPAAPQGQITIQYGLKGFSKTFMGDRMSSVSSIAAAANKVRSGILDVAIAGGTESTNTDIVRTGLEMVKTKNTETSEDSCFNLSEGAVFVLIEREEAAKCRNARIYAQIGDCSTVNNPCAADVYPKNLDSYIRVMREAVGTLSPDVILPDASGLPQCEASEQAAIAQIAPHSVVMRPKDRIGHLFGAEGALDISLACLMLYKERMLPLSESDGEGNSKKMNSILVNASAMGGGIASLILRKGDYL